MIQAIQTAYKGYHFRSRLEARWAVCFDYLGIKWEYEVEGFELPGGVRYLPDFLLHIPNLGSVYVEVKGGPMPSEEDWCKAKTLCTHGNKNVLLLARAPTPLWHTLMLSDDLLAKLAHSNGRSKFQIFDRDAFVTFTREHGLLLQNAGEDAPRSHWPEYQQAANAARSARFEHGQSGATL